MTRISFKKCTNCGVEQRLGRFYTNPLTRDGHASWCVGCEKNRDRREYVQKYMTTDSAKRSARKYAMSDKGKKTSAAYGMRLRSTNPLRAKARDRLNSEVRAGRILRPSRCTECGKVSSIHAHHDDYNKPLAVTWLCAKCHGKEHRGW